MYVRVPSRQHHYFQVGIVQYLLAGFSFSVNKNEMITLNRQTGLEKKKKLYLLGETRAVLTF